MLEKGNSRVSERKLPAGIMTFAISYFLTILPHVIISHCVTADMAGDFQHGAMHRTICASHSYDAGISLNYDRAIVQFKAHSLAHGRSQF